MKKHGIVVESPIGKHKIDSDGAPVGVAHMDADRSYAGTGELLQNFISGSDPESWNKIKDKIDYTYRGLGFALTALETETGFGGELESRLKRGQKLLFKPNLVNPQCIDYATFAPGMGSTACTEWPFIAALMRWFHDDLGISYYRMCIGEAATLIPVASKMLTHLNPGKKEITPEAVIEGKSDNFYCGWGFYFVRKYLAESLRQGSKENPMNGHEESINGIYLPPGHAEDRLMVYDLNRIFDNASKGRSINVPDGVNFDAVTLHKVIVGGDTDDPDDRAAYPGSILINVPKFKVHAIALFTNVIKNLGIGLYPMQYASRGGSMWDYSVPHNPAPGMKGAIPHNVWDCNLDETTCLPERDGSGSIIVKKTGGITATMVDLIKAVQGQDILMIHVVDGIEAINLDHQGILPGVKEPEGMVFAGLDPVAVDLLCARFMFSNVPMRDALSQELVDGNGGKFPQKVHIPVVQGTTIDTQIGYDCPLARDICFKNAEQRGLGTRSYHAVGADYTTNAQIVTLEGHLGCISGNEFTDLITSRIYYDAFKMPWDLQKTSLHYLSAVDSLAGTSLKQEFLHLFDEEGNGVVAYEDFGKKGVMPFVLYNSGSGVSAMSAGLHGALKGLFVSRASMVKYRDLKWNGEKIDLLKDISYGAVCFVAYNMSQMTMEMPDPFMPNLTWGKGKWPSYNLASYVYTGFNIYGSQFPNKILMRSLYGCAFRYADLTQNAGSYAGMDLIESNPEAIDLYLAELNKDSRKILEFKIYIPAGYGNIAGSAIPNVETTEDPQKIFSASFNGGAEVWAAF
jgi:hypothetical protein